LILLKRTTSKKAHIIALLFSTVTGVMFINLATANPAPLFAFPQEPITTLPKIVVQSPVQNQFYNSTNVWLNFTIVKPESWFAINVGSHSDFSPLTETFVNITSIYFTIDGGKRQNIPVHDIDSLFDTAPILNLNFSTTLPLDVGAHSIRIGLEANSYYVVRYVYNFSEALSSVKLITESDVVNLTIVESSKSDTTNLTLNEHLPTALILTASGLTVATVGTVLLVYFKKRKR
jgi:hypothetical protein